MNRVIRPASRSTSLRSLGLGVALVFALLSGVGVAALARAEVPTAAARGPSAPSVTP